MFSTKGEPLRNLRTCLALTLVATSLSGCFFSKIISVPMRVVGAVVSIVPFVGNSAHDAIDTGAEVVDDTIPF